MSKNKKHKQTDLFEEKKEPNEAFHPLKDTEGSLTNLLDDNFLQYASYVICDRAIPSIEDGLKPVQRRILHALKDKDDGRFIKVANIVGHTMQYHPHGDASIADALVTLTNKRYLIEGQGNFGNIYTGDKAAASRYIECRLTALARNEIFNKEITEWIPSYDGRNHEPVHLPSKLPLMLMLGADGIAVGLSTTILPHNFIELLEAQIKLISIKKENLNRVKLDLFPDFQTGGKIDVSEYNKGNGKIKIRGKINFHKNNGLIITELPYGISTDSLISSIEEAIKKKKVPIRSIDDFTAEKVEVQLTLSQGADQKRAREALFAFTKCETSISSRLIFLEKNRPKESTVNEVLWKNTQNLKNILKLELKLKKEKLLDSFHNKTLVQIFVENRIYKKIEQCKTYESVLNSVENGLSPFKNQLKRKISIEDIEMLLGIRIKRISLFDINKNKDEITQIVKDIKDIDKHLKEIDLYTKSYLSNLKKIYKKQFPRLTEITGQQNQPGFESVEVRELTATELQIKQDDNGYIGTNVKGETILECSSLDKLLIVFGNGRYQVMPPPDKLFMDNNLIRCEIYNREKEFTAVYSEKSVSFIKRFIIGGAIMNRDYFLGKSEKSKLLLLADDTPESIFVKFKPVKNQRIHQQRFNPSETLIKSPKSKGNKLTNKPIKYIDINPGKWWDKNDNGITDNNLL
jgi:topoisomerase-4 subunit A